MTLIKLGYSPKSKYKWKQFVVGSEEYKLTEYNNKIVVQIHERLWELVKVMINMKSKGWDNIIDIDGRRRAGKSTLAFTIAYLLNPNMTINNFVSGLEEAPDKIEKAKEEDVLIFDEGSLVAGSKDAMSKKSKQLHKIIDVIGQKRLTLIFVMPSFLSISRQIIVEHSMFLIRVGVKRKTLARGLFQCYKNKRMRQLYDISKKDPKLGKKVKHSFNGKFIDFHLPFEEDYFKLKNKSMHEAINPEYNKPKKLNESELKTNFMMKFKENNLDIPNETIAKGFGMSKAEFYRRKKNYLTTHGGEKSSFQSL